MLTMLMVIYLTEKCVSMYANKYKNDTDAAIGCQ